MKRDEKPLSSLHRTNEIDTSDDTFVLDNEDLAVLEDAISDAQHLTPPPSPPRKQKVSEKRTRPSNERKRLFHDEDEIDTSEPSKITQDIFSDGQIQEIEGRSTGSVTIPRKNVPISSNSSGSKYKKIETDAGRCMFAYYNQTNEDKLASFKPVWINVGPPHLAKELVCLR